MEFATERVAQSRLAEVDFDNLGFGGHFSDHMFCLDWREGAWRDPRIVPYGPVELEPGTASLHYGQLVFEGLKAFRSADGTIRLFRPQANAGRLIDSCARLCIPPPDPDLLIEGICRLVTVDYAWVPDAEGQALYIRPLVIGTEAHLDVRPSDAYRLMVMTAPVRAYFAGGFAPIALRAEQRYTRAAPGGTGFAKTAGNYAAALLPTRQAQQAGYDQVLWLDGREHRYVEEVGQMNIFFRIGEQVVTPPLGGTILPGVTRDSVLQLLRDWGVPVEERPISLDEVADAANSGRLHEAFGSGTAAIVAPISRIGYGDETLTIPFPGEEGLARRLYDAILAIQYARAPDPHGWTVAIDTPVLAAAEGGRTP